MISDRSYPRFVTSSKGSGIGSWYRMATIPAAVQSTDVLSGRAHANVIKRKKVGIRAQIRFLLSLLRTPVLTSGRIANSSGAASRLMAKRPVYYEVYVTTKTSTRIVRINVFKHMQKYGDNIGLLRSRMRSSVLRSAAMAQENAAPRVIPLARNVFAQRVRASRAAVEGIFRGSGLEARINIPKNDIFVPPPGTNTFGIYVQSAINHFMLFKFFYPEVFLPLVVDDYPYFRIFVAALGYALRKDTVLHTPYPSFDRRNFERACPYEYALLVSRSPPLVETPQVTDKPRRHRIAMPKQFRFEWPDPRLAISEYFRYTDQVRYAMESHPVYKATWQEVDDFCACNRVLAGLHKPLHWFTHNVNYSSLYGGRRRETFPVYQQQTRKQS